MARRYDHSPDELRALIRASAIKLVSRKGMQALTARNIAKDIGYSPGTLYNFYADMDALITDINILTLAQLEKFCLRHINDHRKNGVYAFARAYVDFATQHRHLWDILFNARKNNNLKRLPITYQKQIAGFFRLISSVIREHYVLSIAESHNTARLLWACLHGITLLAHDGRLSLVGTQSPTAMIDNLLDHYFIKIKKVRKKT